MIGLFDRDIFLKLCCCDLWLEAVDALSLTASFRLQSTSSSKSNLKIINRMLGNQDNSSILERTQRIVLSVPVLPEEFTINIQTSQAFQDLENVHGIDGGETLLTAILVNSPENRVLLSGDKRFVEALQHSLPEYWDIYGSSIISLEKCMLAIEEKYGFDYLLERVWPVKHCDGSLNLAIGQEPAAENFRDAMKSFNPCRN